MKEIPFSSEVLNDHLQDLKKINDRIFFEKKFKSIYSWLEWLRNKNNISEKQFNDSVSKVNEIKRQNFSKNSPAADYKVRKHNNNSSFVFLFSYKFISIILLFLLLVFNIYIYKLYSSLSGNLEAKQNQGRVLPFKGAIKGTDGKPLDTKRDAVFNLYNRSSDGEPLYSGECLGESGLQPQYNGAFTIMVGSDCGMKPIPEPIFQDNSSLYLGMSIGSEAELLPRYQIFTTTYSKDTSKLQGFEPGKSVSSIPFIDESGMIQIDADSPVIKSTNGTFSIEGKTLSFKAEDVTNGDILIQPGSESNVVIPYGKVGIGTFEPSSILDISGTQLFTSTASVKNFAIPDDENTSVLRLSLGTEGNGVKSNFIEFFAGASSGNPGKKVGDIRVNNDGVVYETAGADFAEYFNVPYSQEIPIGTIISLSPKGIRASVINEKIIGTVSSTAGFIGNRKDPQMNSVLIALVGQVNVLSSTINGEINIGDRVGATAIPGYGGLVRPDEFSVGYLIEKEADENFSNEKCPKSYKNRRDRSGKKIRCGTVRIILDLE